MMMEIDNESDSSRNWSSPRGANKPSFSFYNYRVNSNNDEEQSDDIDDGNSSNQNQPIMSDAVLADIVMDGGIFDFDKKAKATAEINLKFLT